MKKTVIIFALLFLGLAGCQEPEAAAPSNPPTEDEPAAPEVVYLGPRPVIPTPLERGTLFAAPDGSGDECSQSQPCSLRTAFGRLQPGSVLFLRGGIYPVHEASFHTGALAGTAEQPVIIESYPGEWAVLEGGYRSAADYDEDEHHFYYGIRIDEGAQYVYVRRLEVRYMGNAGIGIRGSRNVVEGCDLHHNTLSGVELYGGVWRENDPGFTVPYPEGYNTVRDNVVHDNSDVYMSNLGGNADGVAVSSGRFNRVIHNRVYGNSDDGIDTWRSNDSYVAFNISYDNGRGENGDGNGFKAGGNLDPDAQTGLRTVMVHNLAYDNRSRGFDYNSGKNVLFAYNTAYRNATYGFRGADDTRMVRNIAVDNGAPALGGVCEENSWQMEGSPSFVSHDPASPDFLRPVAGDPFENLGAYAPSETPVAAETGP